MGVVRRPRTALVSVPHPGLSERPRAHGTYADHPRYLRVRLELLELRANPPSSLATEVLGKVNRDWSWIVRQHGFEVVGFETQRQKPVWDAFCASSWRTKLGSGFATRESVAMSLSATAGVSAVTGEVDTSMRRGTQVSGLGARMSRRQEQPGAQGHALGGAKGKVFAWKLRGEPTNEWAYQVAEPQPPFGRRPQGAIRRDTACPGPRFAKPSRRRSQSIRSPGKVFLSYSSPGGLPHS